jgi:hypothetical protein
MMKNKMSASHAVIPSAARDLTGNPKPPFAERAPHLLRVAQDDCEGIIALKSAFA